MAKDSCNNDNTIDDNTIVGQTITFLEKQSKVTEEAALKKKLNGYVSELKEYQADVRSKTYNGERAGYSPQEKNNQE